MLNTKITYHRASTTDELNQILNLQKDNLPQELSATEKQKEGFVTVHHTFDVLKQMNDSCSHIIAKYSNEVVGYALCMTKDFKDEIPILIPMFNEIEKLVAKNKKYIVMGQICISKNHRRQGVFRGLYQYMAKSLKYKYDIIVTEVDVNNTRSSMAHKSIGFKLLKCVSYNEKSWEIIGSEI